MTEISEFEIKTLKENPEYLKAISLYPNNHIFNSTHRFENRGLFSLYERDSDRKLEDRNLMVDYLLDILGIDKELFFVSNRSFRSIKISSIEFNNSFIQFSFKDDGSVEISHHALIYGKSMDEVKLFKQLILKNHELIKNNLKYQNLTSTEQKFNDVFININDPQYVKSLRKLQNSFTKNNVFSDTISQQNSRKEPYKSICYFSDVYNDTLLSDFEYIKLKLFFKCEYNVDLTNDDFYFLSKLNIEVLNENVYFSDEHSGISSTEQVEKIKNIIYFDENGNLTEDTKEHLILSYKI